MSFSGPPPPPASAHSAVQVADEAAESRAPNGLSGEALVRTLRATESALRAEVALAEARGSSAKGRLTSEAENEETELRCELWTATLASVSALKETHAALVAKIRRAEVWNQEKKRRLEELNAMNEAIWERGEGEVKESRDGLPALNQRKDLLEQNKLLAKTAREFLDANFPVEEEGFWKRFLTMPTFVDVDEGGKMRSVANTLLACGVCSEQGVFFDEDEDAKDKQRKRLRIVH